MKILNSNSILVIIVTIIVGCLLYLGASMDLNTSNKVVSGIVYNASFNNWPADVTRFSIRATENTVVTSENVSKFCLPKNSEYNFLIKKAAENKEIKLIVETKKSLFFHEPFACSDSLKIIEKKR